MRTLAIIFGVLAATTIQPALATDLQIPPLYKAPPVKAPPVWTGFYVGVHAGAGWAGGGDLTFSASGFGNINPITLGAGRRLGFVGGGQAGYVWQFTPNWVLGIESDISGTDIGSSGVAAITGSGPPLPANPAPAPDCDPRAVVAPAAPIAPALPTGSSLTMSRDLNWLASMRGRLGYTWDRTLFYATGGIGWGNFGYAASAAFGPSASTSFSDTKTGWVIGGGAEWAFSPAWSLRAEYLHYEFAGTSRTIPSAGGTVSVGWQDTSVDVVRAGLNYRFGERTQVARR